MTESRLIALLTENGLEEKTRELASTPVFFLNEAVDKRTRLADVLKLVVEARQEDLDRGIGTPDDPALEEWCFAIMQNIQNLDQVIWETLEKSPQ